MNATPIADSFNETKKQMQNLYLDSINYVPQKDPLYKLLEKYAKKFNTDDYVQFTKDIVKYTQDTFLLKKEFSLRLDLLSQNGANKFYQFLIAKALEEGIPLRNEIIEAIDEGKKRQRIFACIIHKKCCICGKEITGLHHHKSVAFAGGYDKDKGELPITPLCPECHSKIHYLNLTKAEWQEKYPNYGWIECNDREKEIIKKLYPGYFKAYKTMELDLDRRNL